MLTIIDREVKRSKLRRHCQHTWEFDRIVVDPVDKRRHLTPRAEVISGALHRVGYCPRCGCARLVPIEVD